MCSRLCASAFMDNCRDFKLSNWLRGILSSTVNQRVEYSVGGVEYEVKVVVVPVVAGTSLLGIDMKSISNVFAGARVIDLPLLQPSAVLRFWECVFPTALVGMLEPEVLYVLRSIQANLGGYPRGVERFLQHLCPRAAIERNWPMFLEQAKYVLQNFGAHPTLWCAYQKSATTLSELYDKGTSASSFRRPQLLSAIITNYVVDERSTLDGQSASLVVGSLPVVTPSSGAGRPRRVRAPAVVVQLLANACGEIGTCVTECGHHLTVEPSRADAFESVVATFWAAHLGCLAEMPSKTALLREQLPSALLLNGAGELTITGYTATVDHLVHRFPYTPKGYGDSSLPRPGRAVSVPKTLRSQVSKDLRKVRSGRFLSTHRLRVLKLTLSLLAPCLSWWGGRC
jgi:hypothetical protein